MAVAWSKDKVGRATGDVIVRDPVVLTATLPRFLLHRRPRHRASRSRQCRRRGRRLQRRGHDRRAGRGRRRRDADAHARAPSSAARVTVPLTRRARRQRRRRRSRVSGPGGFALERSYTLTVRSRATQILARRTVQADRQGREPDAVERPVRRSRAGHRQRRGLGRARRRRSMRRRCSRRSTAIRSAAPSRSPAARCRCSMSTSSPARRISRSTRAIDQRIRDAIERAAGAAGLERLVRPVVGRAATTPGSTPTSPTS